MSLSILSKKGYIFGKYLGGIKILSSLALWICSFNHGNFDFLQKKI